MLQVVAQVAPFPHYSLIPSDCISKQDNIVALFSLPHEHYEILMSASLCSTVIYQSNLYNSSVLLSSFFLSSLSYLLLFFPVLSSLPFPPSLSSLLSPPLLAPFSSPLQLGLFSVSTLKCFSCSKSVSCEHISIMLQRCSWRPEIEDYTVI